jgi:16S rRNA (cytosine967-C5)-methyltransferase
MAVQSESAMRAVLALGVNKGDRLLDCCAAPGGKSAYAAALTKNEIEITSWDIHEHRVNMTQKNYERLGVAHAMVCIHDARVLESDLKEQFDVVLVDAPCSAMGLMAHSPDIRYTRKPEDITSLTHLQMEILSVCARYVKMGGTLAYMTCSINKEENEDITDAFISSSGGFAYSKPPQTLYPQESGSDGFYYAVMRRQ